MVDREGMAGAEIHTGSTHDSDSGVSNKVGRCTCGKLCVHVCVDVGGGDAYT